jgi:hypothetical protein
MRRSFYDAYLILALVGDGIKATLPTKQRNSADPNLIHRGRQSLFQTGNRYTLGTNDNIRDTDLLQEGNYRNRMVSKSKLYNPIRGFAVLTLRVLIL